MNIMIFGAGIWGRRVAEYILKTNDNLIGFIDNNSALWGRKIDIGQNSIRVFDKHEVNQFEIDRIIVALQSEEQSEMVYAEAMALNLPHVRAVQLYKDAELFFEVFSKTLRYDKNDHRVSFLRDFARHCSDEGIIGNVAECGVYTGDFAYYINLYFADRKLYLFDTFEGFDTRDLDKERSLNDRSFVESEFNTIGIFDVNNVDIINAKLPYVNNCIIKKGFFPETANGISDTFCFVNLDMDLYQPMLEGLKFFYNKMSRGGIILCHDYYNPNLAGVRKAVKEFSGFCQEELALFPIGDGSSIAIIKM